MRTIEYRGIRSSDPGGVGGLLNPERGWRLETVIAEPAGSGKDRGIHGYAAHLEGRITPGYNDHWWILDAERYKPFGLTLAQTYCYLDEYIGRPLSDEKLELLDRSLTRLRRRGLKSVLRFAYEKSGKSAKGPDLKDILGHIEQLAPVIRAHADVIFVMQAGFVGAWGEWHSSVQGIEKDHGALAAIVARILEALPADRMTQVRVPKYKRWVLEQALFGGFAKVTAQTAHRGSPTARIGFNNDGFLASRTCGGTWPEAPYYSNPGNPEFDQMTDESPYVAVDGELYWTDASGRVDGLMALTRMRLHHYSSFSLWHSYSGREGKRYSIDGWMRDPLTIRHIREGKLSCSEGYFTDAVGAEAVRTQFQYITDHLGYRLELQRAMLPESVKAGGNLRLEVELINRGFAVLHNPRPVVFVLIDADERVTEIPCPDAKPCDWQPFEPGDEAYRPLTHRIAAEAKVPADLKAGCYQVGLWMPDASPRLRLDPRYAVRVANADAPWWRNGEGRYGANILGVVEVKAT